MSHTVIKALFLDVGGVLLTNGWDHALRAKVAKEFSLDFVEMEKRHALIFEFFERGKIGFDEYLEWTIFNEIRLFTRDELKTFIFDAVRPYSKMLEFVKKLKKERGLKIGIVSNEGRELAIDRIDRFQLGSFVDFFIMSAFVHLRKPDIDFYRLAIDVSQVRPTEICYIDDRQLLVESARTLGMHVIHHVTFEKTKKELDVLLGRKNVR